MRDDEKEARRMLEKSEEYAVEAARGGDRDIERVIAASTAQAYATMALALATLAASEVIE